MFEKYGPIRKAVVLTMMVVSASTSDPARAQFVPGHIFGLHHSTNFCKDDGKWPPTPIDEEYIYDINPETGESRIFATIPREWCGVITGMAFSPDGKKLRVASMLLSLIWEFDAQGNRTIALDWSDGIVSPQGCNCIAYDQQGNFYLSSRGPYKVLRFPADGGPPTVLAYHDNNGVIVEDAHALAVGPYGDVYVASEPTNDELIRITPGGEVSVFDVFTEHDASIESVIADHIGNVYVNAYPGPLYKYAASNNEGELLVGCESPEICNITTLILSADRSKLFANSFFGILMAINATDGSFEESISLPLGMSSCGMSTVPLRGDTDSDGDSDLMDLEFMSTCITGPQVSAGCDSADMDADGDVDLFDVRFFLWAHSALQN